MPDNVTTDVRGRGGLMIASVATRMYPQVKNNDKESDLRKSEVEWGGGKMTESCGEG